MVTIFNKSFSSIVEALVYFGWTDDTDKLVLAPEVDGEGFHTTKGTYTRVSMYGQDKVVWTRDEDLWTVSEEVGGMDRGLVHLDGEILCDVVLREAVRMGGQKEVLMSIWSGVTHRGDSGFLDFHLEAGKIAKLETIDSEGDEHMVLALLVGAGHILTYVGDASSCWEAEQMANHLLNQ